MCKLLRDTESEARRRPSSKLSPTGKREAIDVNKVNKQSFLLLINTNNFGITQIPCRSRKLLMEPKLCNQDPIIDAKLKFN